LGICACSSMTRASSSASAASTGPRFHGPGREPIRIIRRMPARQVPGPGNRFVLRPAPSGTDCSLDACLRRCDTSFTGPSARRHSCVTACAGAAPVTWS
jgi:hypothetical protein